MRPSVPVRFPSICGLPGGPDPSRSAPTALRIGCKSLCRLGLAIAAVLVGRNVADAQVDNYQQGAANQSSGPPSGYGPPPGYGPPAGYGPPNGYGPPSGNGGSTPFAPMMGAFGPVGPEGPLGPVSPLAGLDLMTLGREIPWSSLMTAGAVEKVAADRQLITAAESAFRSGDLLTALKLAQLQLAAFPNASTDVATSLRYSPTLRSPQWLTKVGVAVAVRGDTGLDPAPLSPDLRARQGRSGPTGMGGPPTGMGGPPTGMGGPPPGMGMGMSGPPPGMGGGMGMNGPPPGFDPSRGMNGPMNNFGGIGRDATISSRPERSFLNADADRVLRKYTGLVAVRFAEKFDELRRDGVVGTLFADQIPGDFVAGAEVVDRSGATRRPRAANTIEETDATDRSTPYDDWIAGRDADPPMWQPFLVYLGELPSDQSLEKAAEAGLDFVVQFDVALKEGRTIRGRAAPTENITRLRLYRVDDGKSLVTAKPINTSEVNGGVAGSVEEYVDERMGGFWSIASRRLRLEPLPSLSPAAASKRISQLMRQRRPDLTRGLAETRYFGDKRLLEPDALNLAFAVQSGEVGLQLLHGDDAMIHAAAREILDRSVVSGDE